MNYLKSKDPTFFFAAGIALFALVCDILYIALDFGDMTFSWGVFLVVLLGMAGGITSMFLPYRLISLASSFCYSVAAGLMIVFGLPSVSDVWNGVNFIGGNGKLALVFIILFFVCAALSVARCFLTEKE